MVLFFQILNTPHFEFALFQNIREVGHEFVPVGEGNVVSIEFNLMYRWHATLSQKDTTWIEGFFKGVPQFRGKKAEDVRILFFALCWSRELTHLRSRSTTSSKRLIK